MKKFRFRLDKVLQVQELKEKVKMKEVANIDRKIQSLNSDLHATNKRSLDMIEKISIQRQGNAISADLMRSLAYVEILKKQSISIDVKIKFAMHEIDNMRAELTIINIDKKVLQKLKEQKLERFNKEIKVQEQLENDEIISRKSRIVFPFEKTIEEKIARV